MSDVPFHKHLAPRLQAIYDNLMSSYQGGATVSSSTKGLERELFVQRFLRRSFPEVFRFGIGDITDVDENRSGQLDIVAEHPYFCSFPLWDDGPRLYLAENVAFVIEVKSNLKSQWEQALRSARAVKILRRYYAKDMKSRHLDTLIYMRDQIQVDAQHPDSVHIRAFFDSEVAKSQQLHKEMNEGPGSRVPFYAVGFKGWANARGLKERFDKAVDPDGIRLIDGVLQLDKLWFRTLDDRGLEFAKAGLECLLYFLSKLEQHVLDKHAHLPMSQTYHSGTTQSRWRKEQHLQ